ncbi:MAG: PhzF family isomerase, partial [bacterium]|nr:PhzF family isomerase [bacterium]
MKKYTVYQIDSFTRTKFAGNPAGVVINADGLSEKQMQLIARELNNSETAFLFAPDGNTCDGVIRYFTPKTEVPICGHATIAAMYAKALEEKPDSCLFRFKTNVGVLPFEIIKTAHDYKIKMTQGAIQIDEPLEAPVRSQIITALGLTEDDLVQRCPVQIVSTGHSKVMIGIKKRSKLNELEPNLYELACLSKLIKCNGYFVFTLDSAEEAILSHGRMFAPAVGIPEDPVTGNANGPLGAYLIFNKIVPIEGDVFKFTGKQGEKMGRPGTIEVNVKLE